MTDRKAIKREIQDKLPPAEHALLDLKAKLGDAGHEASPELAKHVECGWAEISDRVKTYFA